MLRCLRPRIVASMMLYGLVAAPVSGQVTAPVGGPPPAALPAQASSVAQAGCVLHVWPGADARSSYTGWFHGGAVDGDRRGIAGYPNMHGAALDTAAQRRLLGGIDWARMQDGAARAIVLHDAPPQPQDELGRTKPLIADAPACYDELIVHSVFVEGAALSSKSVRLLIIAKRWRPEQANALTFSAMTVAKADYNVADNAAIDASLRAGFVTAIGQFLSGRHFAVR